MMMMMMMMRRTLCCCRVVFHILREQHRLQNCSNGEPLLLTSGSARCEASLHGCGPNLVCLFYAITTVFQWYRGGDMMRWDEMRRRNPKPTLLPTEGVFNLLHYVGRLERNDTVSYTRRWKSKLAEVMAWGIKLLTFRFTSQNLRHSNHSATEDACRWIFPDANMVTWFGRGGPPLSATGTIREKGWACKSYGLTWNRTFKIIPTSLSKLEWSHNLMRIFSIYFVVD